MFLYNKSSVGYDGLLKSSYFASYFGVYVPSIIEIMIQNIKLGRGLRVDAGVVR